MRLNTHQNGFDDQNALGMYIPFDPKYMYPGANAPSGRYHWKDTYIEPQQKPYDYGLEHLMLQRQDLIFSKIHMLYSEIYERRKILETSLYQINLDQCSFKNMIYAMGDHLWDRNRVELERKIIDLEQDKRREASNYFRDISFIRKELRESLIEKMEEEQKAGYFMNQEAILA